MELIIEFVKKEFLQINWAILVGYFPLGIIGAWRWSVWTFKKIISFFYKNPEGQFEASLSIITPVYNEDPEMFHRALLSWKQNDPQEIIAVIDYTDETCIGIFKKFSENFAGAKLIVTKIPGKRAALADGIKAATSEIVALVDSDTLWSQDIKATIFGPFADPEVGGVVTRQDIIETDTLSRKLFKILLDDRYLLEYPFLAVMSDALLCLSGRTAVYRRIAVIDKVDALVSEKFLGKNVISGDDKALTWLVQTAGWKTKYIRDARVYTSGNTQIGGFLKQKLRWTRNGLRADGKVLFNSWIWKNHKILALHMLDKFISPLALLFGTSYFILSLYSGHWLVAVIVLVWWVLSRTIKIYPHLTEKPKDIFIIPIYIVMSLVMAIIKVYAMVTVDEQGWITRWDKSRLNSLSYIRRIPPYAATAAIIFFMFFVSFQINIAATGGVSFLEKARLEKIKTEKKFFKTEERSQLVFLNDKKFQEQKDLLYQKVIADQYGYYQVKPGETIQDIKMRYLMSPEAVILTDDKVAIKANHFVLAGEKLAIPIEELRKPDLNFYRQKGSARIQAWSYPKENAMRISGKGAFVTIPELAKAINNKNILENIGGKNWILRKNIFIDNGVTLIIDGGDVEWLKLKSDRLGFVWIKSENGNIVINKTKITSWDEENSNFDMNWENGRSYILQKSDGRMDINESELAYLGYFGAPNRGNPYGGPYGVSWKISNGSFRQELSTGSLIKSKIHDNLFGIYTYGITGAVFRDNEVFENLEYGFDPHDDSNNMLIENNHVYRNGNHGIIASKRCFGNIIRGNSSQNNRLHGIMLDRDSVNNLIENNYSSGNVNGIALYHSVENVIINNNFTENKIGIRANNFSKNNYFWYNQIENNGRGILIYQDSSDNYIYQNNFVANNVKIQLKQNSANFYDQKLQ